MNNYIRFFWTQREFQIQKKKKLKNITERTLSYIHNLWSIVPLQRFEYYLSVYF